MLAPGFGWGGPHEVELMGEIAERLRYPRLAVHEQGMSRKLPHDLLNIYRALLEMKDSPISKFLLVYLLIKPRTARKSLSIRRLSVGTRICSSSRWHPVFVSRSDENPSCRLFR